MPTETNSPQFVQAPAQDDPVPSEPKNAGVVSDPRINYDKYRGHGGDYIVNEEGHRVPLVKHNK